MLMQMPLTREIAHAAATDAGDRSMRAANRTTWALEDYIAAALEFQRLWPTPEANLKGELD